MQAEKTTESNSTYQHLEKMSTIELLQNMNQEDKTVPLAVERAIPQIEKVVEVAHASLQNGGRLFYIGAGTSGRLGIVDASECPPTFGVPHNLVNGIIAGGDTAIRKAVEFAEDDTEQGFKDLLAEGIQAGDVLIGIAASGTTPYVIGAVKEARSKGVHTACIVCNAGSPLSAEVEHAIEVVVGPEFVTGSTRMKSGTAQKLVLNMISTSVLIKMGRVKGNKMVDMQLSNHKLVNRGTKMIMEEISVDESTASALLREHGSVRAAVNAHNKK